MAKMTETTAALTNAAATLAAAPRAGLIVANASDTVMVVRFGATATSTVGIPLAAGTSMCLLGPDAPADSVSIFCGGTSKTYTAYEW